MTNFDEKLKEILHAGVHGHDWDKAIDQIKQLISEVIGGDEVKRDVPSNKDDSYESLNAQFKVMKYNQEQIPIRNELREQLRHAFNLKRE